MKQKSNFLPYIGMILVVLFAGGWIANVYKIFTSATEIAQWGGMEIARVIGVFLAPLGAVLGFF